MKKYNIYILYGISILYTLLLLKSSNPFTTNFTHLVNHKQQFLSVLIWLVINLLYYFIAFKKLNPNFKLQYYFPIIIASCLTILTPYHLIKYPIISNLHVLAGYLSFILLNLHIIYTLFYFEKNYLSLYIGIAFILGTEVLYYGAINTLFQASYTIMINTLLFIIIKRSQ